MRLLDESNDSKPNLTTVSALVHVSQSFLGKEDVRRQAYALIKKVEDYPAYMPSVNAIEILNRTGNMMTTRWDAQIDGAPVCWIQQIQTDDTSQEIIFEAIEGDFDVFRSIWSVGESDGQVFLKLLIEYKLGIPIIEEILGPILKEKVKANSEMMLTAIAHKLTSLNKGA